MSRISLYSAVDDILTRYDVDVAAATLTRRESIRTAAKVQYAWPHPNGPYLYVTTSAAGPRVQSDFNHVSAYLIDHDGRLTAHGPSRTLDRRAVHTCVDPTGQYLLSAHNFPRSGLTVHPLLTDGTIGQPIPQSDALDCGAYPHQVRVLPSARAALIVDRGNHARPDKREDPGALRLFPLCDGGLSPGDVIAPNQGYGFGPRHVDFHPTQPWMYVSDERTNQLYMFRITDSAIESGPAYRCTLLEATDRVDARQLGGPIHVHPSGRYVYVANRADRVEEVNGEKVFAGGENSIAVFRINSSTGEPTLVEHASTRSFHVRTFACDPTGQLLVTASIKPLAARVEGAIRTIPAALTVFRVCDDGSLEYVRQYPVETRDGQLQYWMGIVGAS
ncbi:6-phosphogluconolactonase [Trinickia symbiotica]|uniref:3-carboxymuconate cyclase n=1 Tax=Trinickia symbiotica TaxID=863227 RepID=A0A2N7XA15_9BURK|nr:beta-propeller fold lactonase family protein [Trinickia symbiotica]PMS38609.1 3-carboxymuconate cyclase [Trinickia symbiotica]PPK46608.1 6-phosphogluconolactonase [Trinickia symbiotica]